MSKRSLSFNRTIVELKLIFADILLEESNF